MSSATMSNEAFFLANDGMNFSSGPCAWLMVQVRARASLFLALDCGGRIRVQLMMQLLRIPPRSERMSARYCDASPCHIRSGNFLTLSVLMKVLSLSPLIDSIT